MSNRLVFGIGAANELPNIIRELNSKKILMVTDKGIINAGVYSKIDEILKRNCIAYALFDGVEPDPKLEIVETCKQAAMELQADTLIGLGGGSALDIAKVAAVMMSNRGLIDQYFGIDNIPQRGIKTILIPTTAGTGSEVTPIAVLSDKKEKLKKGIVSPYLYCDTAIVDPELTASLPPHITAYTGIDALTHAIEAYTNKQANPFTDTLALQAIKLIGENLPKAVCNGENLDARYNMSLASLYAGMCLGPVNTAAVHALAYPLGGTFDIPHGMANSLLLPYVMEFNKISNLQKFANIALALSQKIDHLSPLEAAGKAVLAVKQLCDDIGIVSHIRELEIKEQAIDEMAEAAMKVTRLLNNNPRKVTLQDVRDIYSKAY